MHKYRVPIPLGHVAFNAQEAFNIARSFGADFGEKKLESGKIVPGQKDLGKFVVKAQVKCEGRTTGHFKENGFHGGIHTVDTISQVKETCEKMLGKKYINDNTEDEGFIVNCVYIQEKLNIEKEIFLSIKLDTKEQCPVVIYSKHGGMSLERQERLHPSEIFRIEIDYLKGI